MSERIRINYTIKLKDLGSEVMRLFEGIREDIENISLASFSTEEVFSLNTLKDIEEMRLFFYDLDQRLSDVETIIKSYLQYTTRSAPAGIEGNAEDSIERIEGLKKILDQMRVPVGETDEISD